MTIENLLSPVGRIVWGHPMRAQHKTNYSNKQPVLDANGQKIDEWKFGVAFAKAEFEQLIWPSMAQEAATAYPNTQPRDFSWKYVDGDGVDPDGKPYSNREGYAGCYVLTVKTEAFCPKVFKWDASINDYKVLGDNEIKCGDYVRVNMNLKVHTNNGGGLYINPNGVELVGYGTEIVTTGANANDMFGGQPVTQLPQGASATPLSSAPVGATMPGATPAAPAAPMAAPAAPMAAPAAPMAAPATDFVANAMGNPAPNATTSPQSAATPPMATGTAPAATTSPTNGVPGMPLAR